MYFVVGRPTRQYVFDEQKQRKINIEQEKLQLCIRILELGVKKADYSLTGASCSISFVRRSPIFGCFFETAKRYCFVIISYCDETISSCNHTHYRGYVLVYRVSHSSTNKQTNKVKILCLIMR